MGEPTPSLSGGPWVCSRPTSEWRPLHLRTAPRSASWAFSGPELPDALAPTLPGASTSHVWFGHAQVERAILPRKHVCQLLAQRRGAGRDTGLVLHHDSPGQTLPQRGLSATASCAVHGNYYKPRSSRGIRQLTQVTGQSAFPRGHELLVFPERSPGQSACLILPPLKKQKGIMIQSDQAACGYYCT